jgi:hypothetical protein
VTASQIIDEIKSLTPEEQAGVVRFVYQLDAERKLSGPELSTLAARFVIAEDPVEASCICETIVRGFYGVNLGSAGCQPAGLGSLPRRT